MDFDEYDYLEKTADDSELPKDQPPPSVGNGSRSDEKDRTRSRSSRHRETDTERDPTHRSKRSRPEDEGTRDPDRRRERSSSRHHEDRERERERHRSGRDSRDERNVKERERERERHERDRGKERDRERGEERPRHHSRSRPDRRQEEEEPAERVKEMVPREKEKEKEREPREPWEPREKDHNSRRYKEKKDEVAEPEADPERDQRTVFAYQIALKADERDVYEFFSRAGKVRDVRLIMDRNSRRSKGVGYIEFYESLSVPMAIALSGQLLFGQPVMVKPSEAEKNLVQSNTAAGGLVGPYSGGARRLYIGNLHFNITEEQLRLVLEPFGQVELVQLPRELETGHCKGYGFVQFARLEDARAALSLNGQLEIAGRVIKVSAVTDQVGMLDVGTNAGDFDDDEGGGLSLNARSRAMLMQKLDRTGAATSFTGALVPPTASPLLQPAALAPAALPLVPPAIQPVDFAGVPSECLLLKNMFDPNAETEPDFDLDIMDDVRDECSKFGTVRHIYVDKNSAGHVYLRFDSASSSVCAQKALHGRWFAGKMILATYMLPQDYEAKFPGSNES